MSSSRTSRSMGRKYRRYNPNKMTTNRASRIQQGKIKPNEQSQTS